LTRHTYPHHTQTVNIVYLQAGWTAKGDVIAHIALDLPYYALSTPLQAGHVMTAGLSKNHSCENYTTMGQCVVTEGLLNSNMLECSVRRFTDTPLS
jgi:hypothetical protein